MAREGETEEEQAERDAPGGTRKGETEEEQAEREPPGRAREGETEARRRKRRLSKIKKCVKTYKIKLAP